MRDIEKIITGNSESASNIESQHITKCLSIVMHYPEIEEMIRIIKKIDKEKTAELDVTDES